MADWIGKHDDAISKAELEYDRFAATRAALPSLGENDFEKVVRAVKQLEKKRPPVRKGRKKQ